MAYYPHQQVDASGQPTAFNGVPFSGQQQTCSQGEPYSAQQSGYPAQYQQPATEPGLPLGQQLAMAGDWAPSQVEGFGELYLPSQLQDVGEERLPSQQEGFGEGWLQGQQEDFGEGEGWLQGPVVDRSSQQPLPQGQAMGSQGQGEHLQKGRTATHNRSKTTKAHQALLAKNRALTDENNYLKAYLNCVAGKCGVAVNDQGVLVPVITRDLGMFTLERPGKARRLGAREVQRGRRLTTRHRGQVVVPPTGAPEFQPPALAPGLRVSLDQPVPAPTAQLPLPALVPAPVAQYSLPALAPAPVGQLPVRAPAPAPAHFWVPAMVPDPAAQYSLLELAAAAPGLDFETGMVDLTVAQLENAFGGTTGMDATPDDMQVWFEFSGASNAGSTPVDLVGGNGFLPENPGGFLN